MVMSITSKASPNFPSNHKVIKKSSDDVTMLQQKLGLTQVKLLPTQNE